jgi:peptidyl-prolyl cis-trans isomerase SurA
VVFWDIKNDSKMSAMMIPVRIALLLMLLLPTAGQAQEQAQPIDRVAAVVNDDVITERELDTEMRRIKLRIIQETGQLPPEDALARQVLERMVVNRLQLQRAEETGVRVDDLTLNKTMQRAAAENGLTLDQFREAIEREGERYASFRERMRDEIAITRLQQQQVQSLVTVTDQEIDDFLALEGDPTQRNIRYRLAQIVVEVPEAATPEVIAERQARAEALKAQLVAGEDFTQLAITDSDGPQALKGGELGWFKMSELPPLFVPIIRELQPGQVSDLVRSPTGFHLIKLIEQQGVQRHLITQTHARHILIQTNELVDDETARRRLASLRERILFGADFGELARSNSDDPGSAAEGGDLGWVTPGQVVPRFEAVMDSLQPGELSEPFQSRFGWHILEVLERRQHDDTAEVRRSQAREILTRRKAEEAIELWLRRLRDEAYVEYIDRS